MMICDKNVTSEYPCVFLVSQSLFQRTRNTQTDSPSYALSMVVKFYRVEADGSMTFDPTGQTTIDIEDFYPVIDGDMTGRHQSTWVAQTHSICALVSDHTGRAFEVRT